MYTQSLSKYGITSETIGLTLGVLLIAWQPFPGGGRIPVFLLFALGVWMLRSKSVDIQSPASKHIGLTYLLLGIPAALSIPGSYDQTGTMAVTAALLIFYVASLALTKSLETRKARSRLVTALTALALLWLVDGYIQFIFGVDLTGTPIYEDRIVGPFEGNIFLGIYLSLLLPIALWQPIKTHPILSIPIAAITGFVCAMSGSRFTLMMFLIACTALGLRLRRKGAIILALLVTIAVLFAVTLSENLNNRLTRLNLIEITTHTSLIEKIDEISSLRITLWTTAMRMVHEHPITGVGANAFKEAYYLHAPTEDKLVKANYGIFHAHNTYIGIISETGLIGFACFIYLMFTAIRDYFQAPKSNRQLASPFAIPLIVALFPLSAQPALFTFAWLPVLMLFYCAMVAALHSHTLE